ncbi:MAG: biopolymer transporter ExbD [Phycisphaeraceae bacterium]|nr:biopolymer transporter ExbD [Phycisphaeraceae bacterium]
MRSLRHKRHELVDNRSIDMTPMIDVVFQLILFFMLTSALVKPNQIELNLPESTSGVKSQEQPQPLVVSYFMKDGKPELRLNENLVPSLDRLGASMLEIADPKNAPQVSLRIEKTLPVQDFAAVVDAVRDAGFVRFGWDVVAKNSAPLK